VVLNLIGIKVLKIKIINFTFNSSKMYVLLVEYARINTQPSPLYKTEVEIVPYLLFVSNGKDSFRRDELSQFKSLS